MPQRRRQPDKRGEALLEAALEYSRLGIPVFPLHSINGRGHCTCGKKACSQAGKHPRTRHGLKDATTDKDTIREWWGRWGAKANIGGVMGGPFVVIDIDPKNGGDASLNLLEQEDFELPRTATARTGDHAGDRGRHFYFIPEQHHVNSTTGLLGFDGIDVRGHGGYVVLPPSAHHSGVEYEWEIDLSEAADLPDHLAVALVGDEEDTSERDAEWEPSGTPVSKEVRDLLREGNWPQGEQRDPIAVRCTRALLDSGEDRGSVVEKVFSALERSEQNPEHPWAEKDVEALVDNEIDNPPPPLRKKRRLEVEQSLTDTGNAERFAERFSDKVRYVPEWKSWVFWVGDRWEKDAEVLVTQRMQEVVKRIPREVGDLGDEEDDLRGKILRWATMSLQATRIKAAVEMAKAQAGLIARPGEFDQDRYLLNCKNGTLDLRTGELRPHQREDMLTRQVSCEFDRDATSSDWKRALHDAFDGSEEMTDYLRYVFGYSLTGDTSEESFFFFHGKPGAGKGTILDSFAGMLGDYAANISARSLTKSAPQSGGAASEDIARLDGIRFALANEFDARDEFAAAQVNTLTGRDKVAARLLYKGTFEFYPQVKIFVAANHLPKQPSSPESGVWRRIKVVPFDHKVEKVDKDLKTRLQTPEARAAILTWALEGCLEWQEREGLGQPPARVAEAVEEYKEDSDPHRVFIEAALQESEGNFIPNGVMFETYQGWANGQGIRKPLSQKALTEVLKERGFVQTTKTIKVKGKRTSARVWEGVRVKGVSDQQQRRYEEAR